MVSVLDLFQRSNTKISFDINHIRWGWIKVYKCIPDSINTESMELIYETVVEPRVFCSFGIDKLNKQLGPLKDIDVGVVGTGLKICGKFIMFDDSWYTIRNQCDVEYHKVPNYMDEMERIGHEFNKER